MLADRVNVGVEGEGWCVGVVGCEGSEPDCFGEFGVGSSVGVGCVKEEAVDAQDAFKVGEAQVLGEVGEIGGEGVHRDDWG